MNPFKELLKTRNLTVPALGKLLKSKSTNSKATSTRSLRALKEGHMKLKLHHIDELDKCLKLSAKEKSSLLIMVEESVKEADLMTIYSVDEVKKLAEIIKISFPKGVSLQTISELLEAIRKSG